MDEEKALKLLRAAKEAEARNCRQKVIRALYRGYYDAVKKEQ